MAARGGAGGGRLNLEQLTEELDLSEEQQEQLRAVFAQLRQRGRRGGRGGDAAAGGRGADVAAGGGGRDPAAFRAQRQRIQAQLNEAIIPVLTPQQREKFRALQAGGAAVRRARVWVLGGDGQPKPVDVAIGISDGSFTEVVSGELEEGQPVITGVNDVTAAGSSRRFTGFRL